MKIKNKKNTVQKWINIKKISNNYFQLSNGDYIKIIKIRPINYFFKSDFEKESILEAYKSFLKICNFDIQIIIQNRKENLKNHIKNINKKINEEKNEIINEIRKKYIKNILENNFYKNSIAKNFFIIIKRKKTEQNDEEIIIEELNDKYIKIKEGLEKCGNIVEEIIDKENEDILYSFFNTRKFLNKKEDICN